jgi:transcriptional regulator with XRE-family HTH domain
VELPEIWYFSERVIMAEEQERRAFGRRLARFRGAAGLTQSQLAEEVGASLNTVQAWEQGVNSPVILLALPLARAVGVPVEVLLDLSEELTREPTPARRGRPRRTGSDPDRANPPAAQAEQAEAKPRKRRHPGTG